MEPRIAQGETRSAEGKPAQVGPTSAPTIQLPRGGGAIRGIGEKFAANPVTGTGSLSIPIPTSPGRSGFGPQLTLSYDSGAGNGPFGFGWHLSVPAITRKTDKGLPRYRDADVFVLSDSDDLVPELDANGDRVPLPRTLNEVDYTVERFRPRIEGLFARIERWTRNFNGDVHWRAISRDNITSLYGISDNGRVADPVGRGRVFSWLLERTYDGQGNLIVYGHVAEDQANVPPTVFEHGRVTTANRYLKRVSYGHRTPYFADATAAMPAAVPEDWCFQLVLDYGEHDQAVPRFDDDNTSSWPSRADAFSSYRAGFEIRTYRRCQRALMFHRFAELGEQPTLVRSMDFSYLQGEPNGYSVLASVTQRGYVRNPDNGTYHISNPETGETLSPKSLPPVEFTYSPAVIDETVQVIDPASLEHLPVGIDGTRYQWIDLDSEGLSGVLTEEADGFFYKRNLGGVFAPVELVATMPSLADLSTEQQFMDLAGDGQLCLVQFAPPTAGYYARDAEGQWQPFAAFASVPNHDWRDANLKAVDMTGDGRADVLITGDETLTWYPSRAMEGFGPSETVRRAAAEDDGPALVFADATQSVYLADLSGDGLTDLVRIRNGEVCYWPSLGYGRFGARVTMGHSPRFDAPDNFDQRRIRLADIDGSGTTDIVYLGRDQVTLYFNRSGNEWSDGQPLVRLPAPDDLASVVVLDLLGNGTACLVWSSPLPTDAEHRMRYVDLLRSQKPHLLIGVTNNLGAETKVHYIASTRSHLQDRAAGKPWLTRLPFPVHVVERVETYDRISGNRFVTRSAYHHGYFDGTEREFRGFGMVEQWDTEEIGTVPVGAATSTATNLDEASFVPPVLTRTWFHTGAYFDGGRISRQFEDQYYREPALTDAQQQAMLLDDTVLPAGLSVDEAREACRSLKGSILRQEVYALDGTEAEARPYSVSERNYTVQRLQARGANPHAVFFTHPREALELHYERKLFPVGPQLRADPRVSHALTLDVDAYGNVLRSVAVGYGRRFVDPEPLLTSADHGKQLQTFMTFTENQYTQPVLEDHAYRAPQSCDVKTYQIHRVVPEGQPAIFTRLFRFQEPAEAGGPHDVAYWEIAAAGSPYRHLIGAASDGLHDLEYEDFDATGASEEQPYRRLVEHARTLYRADDLSTVLPLGTLESLALPSHTLALAFTPGLVAAIYQRDGEGLLPNPTSALTTAGYVAGDGYQIAGLFPSDDLGGRWWVPSGQVFYAPEVGVTAAQELALANDHFFLPRRFRDPFGQAATLSYDSYDLLPVETRDPLDNTVSASHDYRVLQPVLVTDPNGNRGEAVYDALGLLAGCAVRGKTTEQLGDGLAVVAADLDLSAVRTFVADPRSVAPALLKGATTRFVYDVDRFARCGQPSFAASIARETHASDAPPLGEPKYQVAIAYSDGFGRLVQTKVQAEPGDAPARLENILLGDGDVAPGALADGSPLLAPQRWVGTGRTIYNNKGKPVKQYEPFFSATHLYEPEPEMTIAGVTRILGYDPVGRVVATLHPNHTFEKVASDPWRQGTWDLNDTVLIADPAADPDVGAFFARLSTDDYLPTWYQQRIGNQLGNAEQQAAQKAGAHSATPAITYLDSLGRAFLSVADNGDDEKFVTRVEYDIEGQQRAVIDARNNTGMRYAYDVRGTRIRQLSSDAGTRWMLGDVVGKSVGAWDSRAHFFRTEYDALRRPLRSFVTGADAQDPTHEMLFERLVYGEQHPDASGLNLRGRVFLQLDGAGAVTNAAYDFKGNLLHSTRRLARHYTSVVDWTAVEPALPAAPTFLLDLPAVQAALEPHLETETFLGATTYDGLNRPLTLTAPDGSIVRPGFNDANLLERIDANVRAADALTTFVDDIDYNARGQRERIVYGSGVSSLFLYDPFTFRLQRLETLRSGEHLQDLSYTFDPVGNITHIQDEAQPTVYYDNTAVDAHADYAYDPLYRLISATGREHAGSGVDDTESKPHYDSNDWARSNKTDPNDKSALRRYNELFAYDGVGNIESVRHEPLGGVPWTRRYQYATSNNRLMGTSLPSDGDGMYSAPYTYDPHGNMISIPHLPVMQWTHHDELQMTQQQVVSGGVGERTYYVYDAAGQRVRKVTESSTGMRKHERIYVSGFEVYRAYDGTGSTVKLERETLHIMDGQQRVALVETKTIDVDAAPPTPTPLIRYQFRNHLDSALLELDSTGDIISYEEYYPYGSTAYQAGRSLAEVNLKRYRYTGKERDEESGFYYHGTRYYVSWLARWTAPDPVGISSGLNLYAYGHCNPAFFVDPSGAVNTPANDVDKRIMEMTDQQLHEHMRNKLTDTTRYEFVNSATGAFSARARATATNAGMAMVRQVEAVNIEGTQSSSQQTESVSARPECQVACHYGNNSYTGKATPGTSVEGPFPRYSPGPLEANGQTYTYLQGAPENPFYDVWCSDNGCQNVMSGHSLANGLGLLLGLVTGTAGPVGISGAVGEARALPAMADAAEVGRALEQAPGQRIFYARPGGEVAAVRTNGNSIAFDTQTDAHFVDVALREAGRTRPGSHVYVGSGTHGETTGAWAATDPTQAEYAFYLEDLATTASGKHPTLGPQTVFDVATKSGAGNFTAAENTASGVAPKSMTTMRAWCYSTLSR